MITIDNKKLEKLVDFYKKKGGITLIGLNDSQLVEVVKVWKKGSFDLLADTFRENGVETTSLNAGSSFYNKAEHAKTIILEDLTAKEIQFLNSYSFIEAWSKVIKDITHLPISIPNVFGCLFRKTIHIDGIENVKLSTLLNNHPVIISSFIANNIMRDIANNPFNIGNSYMNRDKNPGFQYTLDKMKDPHVLSNVMELTKRTYDVLLSRTNGETYGLGIFLPNSVEKNDGEKLFEDFVNQCNVAYSNLCQSFGIHYVDLSILGITTGNYDFHASPEEIRNVILSTMINQLNKQTSKPNNITKEISEASFGLDGLVFEARKALIEAKNELDLNPNDITTRNVFKEREKEVQVAQLARKSYQKYKRI